MARRVRSTAIDNRSNRLKLAPRKKPYGFTNIGPGLALAYRRTARGSGRWVIRRANGSGGNWTKVLAGCSADDFEDCDGEHVLSFHEAAERARALARGKDGADSTRPVTNAEALDAYEQDLIARSGDIANARRVRYHLPPTLANKPVSLSTMRDYRTFRDGLIEKKLARSTVIRNAKAMIAALNLAASCDPRIESKAAWTEGLGGLSDHHVARNMRLPDVTITSLIGECYALDAAVGLLAEVMAVTGARPVQLARLKIADLQHDGPEPRLLMPSSHKGKKSRKIGRKPVPITPGLAKKLRQAAGNRERGAALLLQSNSTPWLTDADDGKPGRFYQFPLRALFAEAVVRVGLPEGTTVYCLRHSSIIRQLLDNVSPQIVASHHDTSVAMLEKHYSDYITDFSDALIRRGLLDTSPPPAKGKVIPLAAR